MNNKINIKFKKVDTIAFQLGNSSQNEDKETPKKRSRHSSRGYKKIQYRNIMKIDVIEANKAYDANEVF